MKLPEIKTWQSILLGMLVGAVLLATALLVSLPVRMSPVRILPTSTASLLKVYVVGAVKTPGLVALTVDSRVQDALNAAGGVTENADLGQLNLAAIVNDGQKVTVPIIGEKLLSANIENIPTPDDHSLRLNLNEATQKELEELPGIGEEKAKAILLEREKRVKFGSVEELIGIPGITQNIFNQIRPYIYTE